MSSPDLQLTVDSKPPFIQVIPDNSGRFTRGTDMNFQNSRADSRPAQ
jgi:peroxiredoxin